MSRMVIGVRHGEVHNPDGVIYAGLPGFGLSDFGRRQADDVARAFAEAEPHRIVAVYASPLDRAMETAKAVATVAGVDVVPDERLHEWRYWSRWGGKTWEELREHALHEWEAYQSDPGGVTEGESLQELAARVQSWLRDAEAAHPEGIVVGVSHLEPLRAILLRLLGRPDRDLFAIRIGLGEAVRISPDPDPSPALPKQLVAGLKRSTG